MARNLSLPKPLLLAPLLISLLAGACVFGGDADEEATPSPTSPARPAIGRSGPEATPTPDRPTVRPTLPPPPTAMPETPEAGSTADGLVSVVYSYPFIWPADGSITSFMSPEHPNGIDVGFNGGDSMDVQAAAGGTVTFAGGSNDDSLGISIVIDHGNGVSTTYGHLSALRVGVGDAVEIGQVIAIGGSTGISSGNHLHFEVRKDGETVDPLHVLPSTSDSTTGFDIDCETTPFTLPSGSEALINFEGILADGEEIVGVTAEPRNGGPSLESVIESGTEVRLGSPIDFDGPSGLDSYGLEVTIDNAQESQVVNCDFVVQRRDVPTTFYVRAAPPASDVDEDDDGDEAGTDDDEGNDAEGDNGDGNEGSPDDASDGDAPSAAGEGTTDSGTAGAPAPEMTPTPNPWASTPNYGLPTPAPVGNGGGVAQPPSYNPPSGAGAGAQPPSYGTP